MVVWVLQWWRVVLVGIRKTGWFWFCWVDRVDQVGGLVIVLGLGMGVGWD